MKNNTLLKALEILNSTRTYQLWITGGDFNMITRIEEKLRGRRKLDSESSSFKEYIQNNYLIDLPFDNDTYTWNNERMGSQQISSRLDRYLILDCFVHLGGDLCVSILPIAGSDHWPISLQWKNPGNSNRKLFKFEAF